VLQLKMLLTRTNLGCTGSQRGQTLVEYSLIIALLSIVAMAGLTAFQLSTSNLYQVVMEASDAMIDAVS